MENLTVLLGLGNWAKCLVGPDTLCLRVGVRTWMSLGIPHSLQDPRLWGPISLIEATITKMQGGLLGQRSQRAVTELRKSGKWDFLTGLQCLVDTAVWPPGPGKIEGGAQRDAFVAISSESRCSSLSEILCAFCDCFFVSFALLLKYPLFLSHFGAHSFARVLLEDFLFFWMPAKVFVLDGTTWMGAHLGLRHLLVKLSESIQKLKYLNNYLH